MFLVLPRASTAFFRPIFFPAETCPTLSQPRLSPTLNLVLPIFRIVCCMHGNEKSLADGGLGFERKPRVRVSVQTKRNWVVAWNGIANKSSPKAKWPKCKDLPTLSETQDWTWNRILDHKRSRCNTAFGRHHQILETRVLLLWNVTPSKRCTKHVHHTLLV